MCFTASFFSVWGDIEYAYIYAPLFHFPFFIFLIIFATRFSSLFFFFFPEGADWPESASTSTLSLFAELKCPSFVLVFFSVCFFPPPSCYLLSLKRPDGKGSDTLADISVLPDAQNPHKSATGKHTFSSWFFLPSPPRLFSPINEKKSPRQPLFW